MRTRLVVFVGSVGSGKSTQMRLLASRLRRGGARVRVTFLKTGHLFAFALELLLARLLAGGSEGVRPLRALMDEKPGVLRRLFRLWAILDAVSVSIKFLFSIYIPKKLGYTVLVEEYVPAVVADYIYLCRVLGLPLRTVSPALNLVMRLLYLGGPARAIFLDADTKELLARWLLRGTPIERADYIRMQRTLLLSITKKFSGYDLVYVDTGRLSVKETHGIIVNYLLKHASTPCPGRVAC